MTIQSLGTIQFKTHRVCISKDDQNDRIYCFKHTKTQCELESFDREELAADYIIAPMNSIQYYVNIEGD